MNAFNWLLIHAAHIVTGGCHFILDAAATLADGFNALFGPALAVILGAVNPLCTRIGDAVFAAMSPLPTWVGLTLLSIAAGILAMICFKFFSNQTAIGRASDDIKANLLALKLFKDDVRVMFRAQGSLLWAIVRLQRYMLVPVFVMLVPMMPALAQMGLRYQWRPLAPGERTLIHVRLRDNAGDASTIRLEAPAGIEVEVGPVPGGGELTWRVRCVNAGRHRLRFVVTSNDSANERVVEKELFVATPAHVDGTELMRVSAARVGPDWTGQLLHPAEAVLDRDAGIESIEIEFPPVASWIHGSNWWILTFFVVSMVTAIVLKPIFRVRF